MQQRIMSVCCELNDKRENSSPASEMHLNAFISGERRTKHSGSMPTVERPSGGEREEQRTCPTRSISKSISVICFKAKSLMQSKSNGMAYSNEISAAEKRLFYFRIFRPQKTTRAGLKLMLSGLREPSALRPLVFVRFFY